MPDDNIKGAVQRQFANVAANYRKSKVHAAGADLDTMVEAAALTGAERVLDAGSGAGHTALAFAPHVAEVIACDMTPPMLEQVMLLAQERGVDNVGTRAGDVENLPFADDSFDRVVSRYSAHHWPHPDNALREFERVLKPGGMLLISDIVAAESPVEDTFLQTIEFLRDSSHVRDHRVSEWHRMFRRNNFKPDVRLTWSLRLEFVAWVERMATPETHRSALRALFAGLPDDLRAAFQVESDANGVTAFYIPGALVVGSPVDTNPVEIM